MFQGFFSSGLATDFGFHNREALLHYLQVGTFCPAVVNPKCLARNIVRKEKNIAFQNAASREIREAGFNELPAQPALATGPGNGEVMQIAASPVIPAQNRPDNFGSGGGNPAHTGVARQKRRDVLPVIRFIQTNTLGVLPKPQHRIKIGNGHGADGVVHFCERREMFYSTNRRVKTKMTA